MFDTKNSFHATKNLFWRRACNIFAWCTTTWVFLKEPSNSPILNYENPEAQNRNVWSGQTHSTIFHALHMKDLFGCFTRKFSLTTDLGYQKVGPLLAVKKQNKKSRGPNCWLRFIRNSTSHHPDPRTHPTPTKGPGQKPFVTQARTPFFHRNKQRELKTQGGRAEKLNSPYRAPDVWGLCVLPSRGGIKPWGVATSSKTSVACRANTETWKDERMSSSLEILHAYCCCWLATSTNGESIQPNTFLGCKTW